MTEPRPRVDLPMDFADATLIVLAEGLEQTWCARRTGATSAYTASVDANGFGWCLTGDDSCPRG